MKLFHSSKISANSKSKAHCCSSIRHRKNIIADDDNVDADVIFPPIPDSTSAATIALHDDCKNPSAPRSSPSPTKVPTFIDLSDEPDDGEIRIPPIQTHQNPLQKAKNKPV